MDFVKLIYDGEFYNYVDASNVEMNNLGNFLAIDVGCYWASFKKWALDSTAFSACGNITSLSKKNNYIYISELYPQNEACLLKMTIEQFVQLLDDWEAKVCKKKPKEVIIKYENDQFTIETKD